MERWIGKIAVITGASSGIGLAVAKALLKEGMNVIGLARRKGVMEELMQNAEGNGQFYAVECDISKESNVNNTFEYIRDTFGTVHILVNNAGIVLGGKIIDTERSVWEKVFAVNVMGMLQCSQQSIRMMNESGHEAHIINVNSVQGHRVFHIPNIQSNVYAATKHAVTAITETLQNELIGGKIKVTSISPGYVKTNIVNPSNAPGVDFSSWNGLDPEDVADTIMYLISTPPHIQITELTLKKLGENFRNE